MPERSNGTKPMECQHAAVMSKLAVRLLELQMEKLDLFLALEESLDIIESLEAEVARLTTERNEALR